MARNEQLIRQHKILQILERNRFGQLLPEIRDELVNDLGLSSLHERSVRRDLEALQAAGLDVGVHDSPRGKVWKLGPRARGTYSIAASATELIALSLSRDLLYPLVGTPFWQGIETFWNKLREELPETVWKHCDDYRKVLYVRGMPTKSYAKQQGVLATIHRATMEHRIVEIEYQPPGKDLQRRKIEPYAVVFYQGSLYIIAAASEVPEGDEDRIRHLKLDRFVRATALDAWFQKPKEFDLASYMGQGLGMFSGGKARDFRIRISQRAARWIIEDPWHADQKIETQKDGSIILTVKAAHDLEIIPRVLALANEAEILAPASCRKQIASIIEGLAATYRSAPAT
ncbi:transcriptional regulator protein-like protein [Pirellula staleyi DSM 6068]|uniref:Transcriptional regulator protein-like protein n=1 Tax=Pirellula staleyi (strain ATCC 27377 / DSM 6068 / ICPB 4128) TaxID=530564 RepID=D2R2U5_PIRSD|nr:WYL domain-containing protein [Pirellula staleyi]ADB16935.1 transcriptional regulator protein-like protein [Pirellula staleyi DSM 6068]